MPNGPPAVHCRPRAVKLGLGIFNGYSATQTKPDPADIMKYQSEWLKYGLEQVCGPHMSLAATAEAVPGLRQWRMLHAVQRDCPPAAHPQLAPQDLVKMQDYLAVSSPTAACLAARLQAPALLPAQ